MRIKRISSAIGTIILPVMASVVMALPPAGFCTGEYSIEKEEIKFEQTPVLSNDEKESGVKQEITFTHGPSKQKEKLPIKTYAPEMTTVIATTTAAAATTTTKTPVRTNFQPGNTSVKETAVKTKVKIAPIISKLVEVIQFAAKDMRPVAKNIEPPAKDIHPAVGIEPEKEKDRSGAAPFVRMVNDVLSGPQDFTSALAKESAAIASMGTWDEMKKKKRPFSSEIGLAGIKVSKEEKPAVILTLKECIDIAAKNNLQLQIAKKNVRLAEIRICEARRNLLPSASMVMMESIGRVNARAYISKKTYFEGQQPLFHGGELYYNLKQAQANMEITKSDYDRTRNDLVLKVKKAYYSMTKSKENLKIQKELSDETARISDMVNKAFESNIVSKLEFLNVTSQVSQVRYQFAAARNDLSLAELILKQAMHIDTKDRIDVAALPPFKKIDLDFENTLYSALVNRPEMRINALKIDYYNYGKGIARAKGLPRVDLMGQWGMSKDEYMSLDQNYNPAFPSDDRKMSQQWYAGLKASMPIWGSTVEYSWTREQWPPQVSVYSATSSNTNQIKLKLLDKLDYYSDKKLAEIDYDKAREELVKIRQDVTLETREGCFNYEKAILDLEQASSKLAYQTNDLEVTKFKRALDETADSNVIESMLKLSQEKFHYAQATSDCRTAIASINKAVGVEDYYKDE